MIPKLQALHNYRAVWRFCTPWQNRRGSFCIDLSLILEVSWVSVTLLHVLHVIASLFNHIILQMVSRWLTLMWAYTCGEGILVHRTAVFSLRELATCMAAVNGMWNDMKEIIAAASAYSILACSVKEFRRQHCTALYFYVTTIKEAMQFWARK